MYTIIQSESEKTLFSNLVRAILTLISHVGSCTMCIPLTLVLYYNTTTIEVYLQCFKELVSLKELGKSTSCEETRSHNSLYFKAVKTPRWGLPSNIAEKFEDKHMHG